MSEINRNNPNINVYLRIRPPTSEYTYIDDID